MASLPLMLGVLRMLLGPVFVLGLAVALRPGESGLEGQARAHILPLVVAGLASLTDFVDGRLARRFRVVTTLGAVLDVAADAVFLLFALTALAAAQLISWWLPFAAAASLAALAIERSRHVSDEPGSPHPASKPHASALPARGSRGLADWIGHAAGVLNFGAVLVASGVPAGIVAPGWLPVASRLVAVVNLAPLVLRALAARAARRGQAARS